MITKIMQKFANKHGLYLLTEEDINRHRRARADLKNIIDEYNKILRHLIEIGTLGELKDCFASILDEQQPIKRKATLVKFLEEKAIKEFPKA